MWYIQDIKKIITAALLIFISIPSMAQLTRKLVWQDEFNYTGLPDPSKWDYEVGHIRNNEKQYYTRARKENIWVENGTLKITGRKEGFVNGQYKAGATSWQQKDSLAGYTSASINTLGKASWRYGRIEISAKLPKGGGCGLLYG
jgi:beta-glucanase (GH16 family)